MGIREEIQSSVAVAFDTDLSDAVQSFILRQVVSGYNELTAEATNTFNDVASRGVFEGYTARELYNSAIKPTDVKVLVLQNELVIAPMIDNFVVQGANTYKVISVKCDPANVSWELQCRQ